MNVIDRGSLLVMGITLVLFALALFLKGMTHDLLLEAGVFLISVKLMLMAHKNSQKAKQALQLLEDLTQEVKRLRQP